MGAGLTVAAVAALPWLAAKGCLLGVVRPRQAARPEPVLRDGQHYVETNTSNLSENIHTSQANGVSQMLLSEKGQMPRAKEEEERRTWGVRGCLLDQVLPAGSVPTLVNVPGMGKRVPLGSKTESTSTSNLSDWNPDLKCIR